VGGKASTAYVYAFEDLDGKQLLRRILRRHRIIGPIQVRGKNRMFVGVGHTHDMLSRPPMYAFGADVGGTFIGVFQTEGTQRRARMFVRARRSHRPRITCCLVAGAGRHYFTSIR